MPACSPATCPTASPCASPPRARDLAERVIRNYCLAKGVAVALNPIPVADLLAAASLDVALVRAFGKSIRIAADAAAKPAR